MMKPTPYYILAVESSCDDTSAAVINSDFQVLSNVVASQKVHSQYGGVVPELASRSHQSNIVPTIDSALKESGIKKTELAAVSFTCGPGLLGSLMVGVSFAKAFAQSLSIPLISVNHLEAHILAHFIKSDEDARSPSFPFLCLLVSGGNTQIVLVRSPFDFEIIGKTIDDAAGETIDKAAKILSLPYPGGPIIDKLAVKGDPHFLKLSSANLPNYDYSFSGLKTSFLYSLRDKLKVEPNFIKNNLENIASSIQYAVISSLIKKFSLAIKNSNVKDIAIAGGVAANSLLQKEVTALGQQYDCRVFLPKLQYSTDNAAMVAAASLFKFMEKRFASLETIPFTRTNQT